MPESISGSSKNKYNLTKEEQLSIALQDIAQRLDNLEAAFTQFHDAVSPKQTTPTEDVVGTITYYILNRDKMGTPESLIDFINSTYTITRK